MKEILKELKMLSKSIDSTRNFIILQAQISKQFLLEIKKLNRYMKDGNNK